MKVNNKKKENRRKTKACNKPVLCAIMAYVIYFMNILISYKILLFAL